MISHEKHLAQRGFTLVELLIVVIILAILAAIIIPQFTAATDDATQSAYDTNIANIRSAVDLYRQQHGEYPGRVTSTGAGCPAGSANVPGAADARLRFSHSSVTTPTLQASLARAPMRLSATARI